MSKHAKDRLSKDHVMRLYEESGGNMDEAVRCAHCKGEFTHPTSAPWLKPSEAIVHKDTVWSVFCCYLGCEFCPGITGVHLMFCKGNTWVHTEAMKSR